MGEPILFKGGEGTVRGEGTSYAITNYLTAEGSGKMSVAVSELNGKMWKTINKVSDRAYYLIEGRARFEFGGKAIDVGAGDVLFIPSDTPYSMEGRFRAVLINSPPFDIRNESKPE